MIIVHGDNLDYLKSCQKNEFDLIYIDPPYNTDKIQTGRSGSYQDSFSDFKNFIKPRLEASHKALAKNGSIYVHLDYRSTYIAKQVLDSIFGEKNFVNEIIWSYDFGGRGKRRWPAKHDNILFYVKSIDDYTFNWEDIERIPYMAPGLCGPEKAERGKVPTDVWWMSIVGTQDKSRTGYPTQKPVKLIERIVQASSNEDGNVLDFFAGSGTTGEACMNLNRECVLVDSNSEAIAVMWNRFKNYVNPPTLKCMFKGCACIASRKETK